MKKLTNTERIKELEQQVETLKWRRGGFYDSRLSYLFTKANKLLCCLEGVLWAVMAFMTGVSLVLIILGFSPVVPAVNHYHGVISVLLLCPVYKVYSFFRDTRF